LNLFFQSFGSSGRPLIILHGLLGSSDNWHTLGKRFAGEFQVFIPDARNHGRSPHADAFDYGVMADDIRDFMRQHSIPSAHILGHSMGGKTAMTLALHSPSLIDRLVVVDIGPGPSPDSNAAIVRAMLGIDLQRFNSRTSIDQHLSSSIPDATTRQFIMKNLRRDDEGMYSWKVNLASISTNLSEMERGLPGGPTFSGTTLFVRGEKSDYLREMDPGLLQSYFPQCRLVTIPNAGHWVHADAPEELYRTVSTFLKREQARVE